MKTTFLQNSYIQNIKTLDINKRGHCITLIQEVHMNFFDAHSQLFFKRSVFNSCFYRLGFILLLNAVLQRP